MHHFRSKFEKSFWTDLSEHLEYEETVFPYTVPLSQHKYTPDFHIKGTNIFLETKGIFDLTARKKMLLVRDQHPDKRFIMVFQNPLVRISGNSKTTYAAWCTKHKLEWMTVADAKQLVKENA